MQELVVNGLLAFVALSAAGGRLAAAVRPGGMTGRQRKMLTRILLAAAPPPRRQPTFIIKDVRLFLNSVDRGLRIIRDAGVDAACGREETEEDILLTIRIPKHRTPRP